MVNPPVKLKDFLVNSNLEVSKAPPLVHSTGSHRIFDILQAGKILALPCNVFHPDRLCYCFVGRPAYKSNDIDNPADWELPMAFVLRFESPPSIKRVFPFDSGAFRQRRLPSYITLFKIEGYDISGDPRNIGRLISFIYKTPDRYVTRKAAGYEELKEEYSLNLYHQEILAIAKLALENSSRECDDRAAAIEVQIDEDVSLTKQNLLGVVVPDEFKRAPGLIKAIKEFANHVETYEINPLSSSQHYGQIYDAVRKIYKKSGVRF
jgi:hypothetical protein